ncbi:MAG: hypothetical protein KIC94_08210 [Clostridiales bacterium]|nr:hypothetical protein [Clostridiales bacterium]
MKLKLRYFIRGLGIGIVFTAIVMSLSLQASRSRIIRENALTKEEIMEKAMGYGMIMSASDDTTSVEQKDPSKEEQSQEKNQDVKEEQDAEDDQLKESNDDDQQNEKDEKDNKDKVEPNVDSTKDKDLIISIDYTPIKITSGMTATSVGKLLNEKGVIEDADEFRTYMSEQGYSSKILVGEYLIPLDATYKKIADIITRKK